MADVNKIDSNITGLRYAEEASLKTLPGSPVWNGLEPNEYDDFGGTISTIARNPISDDRQRKKGVVSDLESAGGFNNDLTQSNLQELMQGFFFADLRRKGEEPCTGTTTTKYNLAETAGFLVNSLVEGSGFTNSGNNSVNKVTVVTTDTSITAGSLTTEGSPPAAAKCVVVGYEFDSATLDVDVSGDLPRLTRASGAVDFTTLGIIPGEWIFVGGDGANEDFVNVENNGFKRVRSVAATYIELDKSTITMTTETGTGLTVRVFLGRVLKNETGTDITRRTYQLERTLGAPDDALPTEIQSEYIVGAVANELVFNFDTADKVTCDLSFMAADHETRSGATGVKSGTRPDISECDAFNTSTDFTRIKLSSFSDTNEAPDPLFAFVQDFKITINNNVSANKAIGTLGAFDLTAGMFQVSGEMTAYFSDVAAIASVRANADITLDMAMVKDNSGVVIDLPLISLSDSKANIEQDAPITLPLTNEAASGACVNSTLDHTLMMVFFDYLPDAADV